VEVVDETDEEARGQLNNRKKVGNYSMSMKGHFMIGFAMNPKRWESLTLFNSNFTFTQSTVTVPSCSVDQPEA
jgi:hypothetical protein